MVTFSVLLHEDTCSVVQETFLYKGLGEGWDKARFGICLNVQKGSGEDTQKMNTVVTKSNGTETVSTVDLLIFLIF